jgi:aldehyde dehydrogenase (NAD+)
MKTLNQIYINGEFVTPHGSEVMEFANPSTGAPLVRTRLADATDAQRAIAAARAAYPVFSRSTREERMDMLQRLHDAVREGEQELIDTMLDEYGGPLAVTAATARRASSCFVTVKNLLAGYSFERQAGIARVQMVPLGVVGLITPWNANYGFISGKLAMAIASGSTAVIKPSEMSALQTDALTRLLHKAGLPPGVFNIVTGRGDTVGAEITRHPDIAKISFTGSTAVGKAIARGAVDTMKRVTLELGGKSPTILLDDADFAKAMPFAVAAATFNSGQACLAGTRLLVPEHRLEEAKRLAAAEVAKLTVGDPRNPATRIGPMVSHKQWERVQGYIRKGLEEGAELLAGGEGKPAGLEAGNFVRPTVFVGVRNDMAIAREEIFGPVLSIISYRTEEEAIDIANDTSYGLHAYVFSGDVARANRVAAQIVAGRVFINGLYDEPLAPFGGFRQSGLGREFGVHGLEAYLEPKALMGYENAL